jgi:hypothetical protein
MKQNLPPKKKQVHHYSKGELNRIVDSLLHPFFGSKAAPIVVDLVLHALVEKDPEETTTKFIRYSLPKIINLLKREKD